METVNFFKKAVLMIRCNLSLEVMDLLIVFIRGDWRDSKKCIEQEWSNSLVFTLRNVCSNVLAARDCQKVHFLLGYWGLS